MVIVLQHLCLQTVQLVEQHLRQAHTAHARHHTATGATSAPAAATPASADAAMQGGVGVHAEAGEEEADAAKIVVWAHNR